MVVLLVASAALVVAALGVLTGAGARRRGNGWALAGASGLLFPVTWVLWYVRDRRAERLRSRPVRLS
ncbi:hypothetical protein [Nocardioides panaciterrulae]|uniref:Cardiolipin synthase N-terminal domain-containing protein n=1 Tax=Nocardioides panaciterrulae TaxID=661492 RepID=A0A7Y9E3U7_9ACTN|nr:hypothetical protein [Nocardioides panaciterrulae]NYD40604.1 hypothetical protein [Nocardioides panaciterrulae]